MERMHKQDQESANRQRVAQAKFTSRSREIGIAKDIDESPVMTAQRQRLDGLFGGAIQRAEDEEPLQGRFEAVQRAEEEEPLQGKFGIAQRVEEEEPVQGRFETTQMKHELGEEEFLPGRFGAAQRKEDEEPLQGKFDTAQRVEEEDSVQGRFDPVQRKDEEEPLQGKFEAVPSVQLKEEAGKSNNTGLPDNLKSGIESLSGMSMDNVRVHYNSSQPAQLNAHAYAQGTDIHVAPGQEQHLPHEAWHVVQQAQGRVRPTMQMKQGVPVNDDHSLEHEADVMGAKAVQMRKEQPGLASNCNEHIAGRLNILQKKTDVDYDYQYLGYQDSYGTKKTAVVGCEMTAKLDPGDPIQGSEPGSGNAYEIYDALNYYWGHSDAFIKGHLLNAHLGGLGVPANLFPITASANARHKEWEYSVKETLLGQIQNKDNGQPYQNILYKVEASDKSNTNYFDDNPESEFSLSLDLVNSSGFGSTRLWKHTIESKLSSHQKGINNMLTSKGWGASGSGVRTGVTKVDKNTISNDTNYKNWYQAGIEGGYVEGNRVLAVIK